MSFLKAIGLRLFSVFKPAGIFVLIFSLILQPAAFAIPTGTGTEQFPIGTDAGDEFNVGAGKFVVQGNTGNVGIGTITPGSLLSVAAGMAVGSGLAYRTLPAPTNGMMISAC